MSIPHLFNHSVAGISILSNLVIRNSAPVNFVIPKAFVGYYIGVEILHHDGSIHSALVGEGS